MPTPVPDGPVLRPSPDRLVIALFLILWGYSLVDNASPYWLTITSGILMGAGALVLRRFILTALDWAEWLILIAPQITVTTEPEPPGAQP